MATGITAIATGTLRLYLTLACRSEVLRYSSLCFRILLYRELFHTPHPGGMRRPNHLVRVSNVPICRTTSLSERTAEAQKSLKVHRSSTKMLFKACRSVEQLGSNGCSAVKMFCVPSKHVLDFCALIPRTNKVAFCSTVKLWHMCASARQLPILEYATYFW